MTEPTVYNNYISIIKRFSHLFQMIDMESNGSESGLAYAKQENQLSLASKYKDIEP